MRELDTLIRVQRWHLSEKRRALAELESLAEGFRAELQALEEEVAREREAAAADPRPTIGFAAYLEAARTRRRRLEESIAQVDEQILVVRDEITATFQDLKGYEVARDNRQRRADARQRRRDTLEMDEVAVTGYQRRRSAGPASG